jgi:hypothetical protein
MAELEGSNWSERRCGKSTHGMTNTPEWISWTSMRQRCHCESAIGFHNYGGRGIKVCERWMNSFENFYADMGNRPEGMSLDRIDNDGDYCPDNCKWSSHVEQGANQRTNRFIEHDGERLTLAQWSRRTGLSKHTIRRRLIKGWSIEKTLNTPLHATRKNQLNASKLKEADVLDIRASDLPASELAKQFGVTVDNIYAILKRKSWKHI